jgi:hypothetical protein
MPALAPDMGAARTDSGLASGRFQANIGNLSYQMDST